MSKHEACESQQRSTDNAALMLYIEVNSQMGSADRRSQISHFLPPSPLVEDETVNFGVQRVFGELVLGVAFW